MLGRLLFFFVLNILLCFVQTINYRPAVFMHGILTPASDMNEMIHWLQSSFPGIYAVSIEVGNGYIDSYSWPMNKQVDYFCQQVKNDDKLRHGFNMLGFSQGSLIVRAAVERCSLPVYNLITLSGVHQGIYGIPYALQLPLLIRQLISKYAYHPSTQNQLSISNWWRDPTQLNRYRDACHFLPDINNENEQRNETYRNNMLKLNAFVMTYSDIDNVVIPRESGWFMGYKPNTLEIEPWNQSRQFTQDLIGLETLRKQGKLYTFISHSPHVETPHTPNRSFFMNNILSFFNNTIA